MRTRVFCLFFGLLFFSKAILASNQIQLSVGPSVPASVENLILPSGLSRSGGGERIIFQFSGPKTITSLRISAYSTSRLGKALMHNAVGIQGSTKIPLEGLYKFGKSNSGNPTNSKGKNMLADSSFVEVFPAQSFQQIEITAEGYTNNDISLWIQITSTDSLLEDDYLITRTGTQKKEFVGSLIDESLYAQFTPSQVQKLIGRAQIPQLTEMSGRNFSCTTYSRTGPAKIDSNVRTFKTDVNGSLESQSDLEGPPQKWMNTEKGFALSREKFSGCGKLVLTQTLRQLGSGSLISEVSLHTETYIGLCASAGYDEGATRKVLMNTTYPSLLDPAFVVRSYEFCRPL